jgi:hypothetical protein
MPKVTALYFLVMFCEKKSWFPVTRPLKQGRSVKMFCVVVCLVLFFFFFFKPGQPVGDPTQLSIVLLCQGYHICNQLFVVMCLESTPKKKLMMMCV